jgi:hypothetical protein
MVWSQTHSSGLGRAGRPEDPWSMHPIANAQVLREVTRSRQQELAGRGRRVTTRTRVSLASSLRVGAAVATRGLARRAVEERQ